MASAAGWVGIIPARAGFTPGATAPAPTATDHPRSRGVYTATSPPDRSTAGSSPLARGLRRRPSRRGRRPPDHPRSRGVYVDDTFGLLKKHGSSPLARGLRVPSALNRGCFGIIPARAGFTGGEAGVGGCGWDHPRSRGVYRAAPGPGGGPRGSSPLARGLLPVPCGDREAAGIIPARAGFTTRRSSISSCRWDHPRSRGVYFSASGRVMAPSGSSPLARGLHNLDGDVVLPVGCDVSGHR